MTKGQGDRKEIIIKKAKEKSIRNYHPWIFSGAVLNISNIENGEIASVLTENKELLGHAYINKNCSIIARMINFDNTDPLVSLKNNIENAFNLRKEFFDENITNCYRLINAEGDNVPGLIVDKYKDIIVIQISTLGIEKLKSFIIDIIVKRFNPIAVYEKSNNFSRKEEGLSFYQALLYGKEIEFIEVLENSLKFKINILESQKTGFFLDQRNMRELIKNISKDKTVLNGFGFTGAFSVYSLKGGAKSVCTIDSSKNAIEMAKENILLNGFDIKNNICEVFDMFDFLRENPLLFDIIILDPPAFAKKKKDIVSACRAYKDINRTAIKKIHKRGLILTSSCSNFIDETLFEQVIFQAASEAGRDVKIIQKHSLAYDHPINIYHKEGLYLKSLLLYVG